MDDGFRARVDLVATARHMSQIGLSPGRSGNLSLRAAGGMLITPSGLAYEETDANDIVFVTERGDWEPGGRKPSSEWHFHSAIYRARADIAAIVHTHSLHATALACTGREIPAFHYMVAVAGGADIPCAPYATFGTEALAGHAVAALAERNACLLAHHGVIACGGSLKAAFELAQEVEGLAQQYLLILALGEPVALLPAEEMARVLEKFRTYGQNAQRAEKV